MSVNSHTSSLFHYTKSCDDVISILQQGLKFSYCKEKFTDEICVGIPMICFCDIPISRNEEHSEHYGNFAIGFTKRHLTTVTGRFINPVNYIMSDRQIEGAMLLRDFANAEKEKLSELIKEKKQEGAAEINLSFKGKKFVGIETDKDSGLIFLKSMIDGDDWYRKAISLIGFMKRYEDKRKKGVYINYNECEWRLVLPENTKLLDGSLCEWFWSEQQYDKWRKGRKDKFVNFNPVPFDVMDITTIIVPTEADKLELTLRLSKLKKLCGWDLSKEQRTCLLSKVISSEYIKKNF